ncbi:hypothetical protein Sjap_019422 [Stephania japonica]|uniref:Uncharacterized protein n=1 Tax=Stephania japonica TaxID=461633 RepID=A0AAP0F411_9MAGN
MRLSSISTKKLAATAPDATFSFFSTTKSNASLFPTTNAFPNITPYNVGNCVPENYKFSGHPLEPVELFLKVTPGQLQHCCLSDDEEDKLHMSDAFFGILGDIADDIEVPWVPIWAPAASSLSLHCYTDLIRQTVGPDYNVKNDDPLTLVPGMPSALCVRDIPAEVLNGESTFFTMLHKMGKTITRDAAVAVNSFDELELSIIEDLKFKFRHCLSVRPFNLIPPPSSPSPSSDSDHNGCLDWLPGHEPASVACIGFGTVMTPSRPEQAALAEAVEASGMPFIWSIPERAKANLPQGFLERVGEKAKVVSWAPQTKVNDHGATGVLLSHGGWISVLESISGGVPMICRPFFGDQNINARLVSQVWKIGVELKDGKMT